MLFSPTGGNSGNAPPNQQLDLRGHFEAGEKRERKIEEGKGKENNGKEQEKTPPK